MVTFRITIATPAPPRRPIAAPIEQEQVDWSARVAVGLDKLAADFELDALTYYYRGVDGNESERLGAGVIVGNHKHPARQPVTRFFGALGWLAQIALFFVLGLLVTPYELGPVILPALPCRRS